MTPSQVKRTPQNYINEMIIMNIDPANHFNFNNELIF